MATNLSNMTTEQLKQLQMQLQSSQQSQPNLSQMSTQQLQQMQTQLSQPQQQQQPNPSFLFPLVRNKELSGAESQLANNPARAGKEAVGGAMNAVQGFLNLGNKLQAPYLPKGKELSRDYIKSMGVNDEQAGDQLLQNIALSAVPEAVPTKGMSLLKRLAVRGAEGETYGEAGGAPAGTGAALGIGLGASSAAAEKTLRGITGVPAKLLRGTASPEEMIANRNAAGNAPMNMGQISKSPLTNKFYENFLSEVPGSGVQKNQNIVANAAQTKAEDLLATLQKGFPTDVDPNTLLHEKSIKLERTANKAKNDMYDRESQMAAKEGHQLDLSSFAKKANGVSSMLENSPLLQADPELRKFMNKARTYGEAATPKTTETPSPILGPNGKPAAIYTETEAPPTLSEANMAKSTLYRAGQAHLKSPAPQDRAIGKLYLGLSKELDNAVEGSIAATGSPGLQKLHAENKERFKTEYAPYLDKKIYKLLDKSADPDALARTIINPSGKKDAYSTIKKWQAIMPEKDKKLLPYAYLSNAIQKTAEEGKVPGKVDPKQLAGLINGLGRRQFRELFPTKQLRQQALDYGRFRGMSEDALNAMHNPKTGARNLKSLSNIKEAALMGGGAGFVAGGPIGAAVGAVAAPLTLMGSSRALGKYLSNPETRDKLLARMLDQERLKKGGVPTESTLGKVMARMAPRIIANKIQSQGNQ